MVGSKFNAIDLCLKYLLPSNVITNIGNAEYYLIPFMGKSAKILRRRKYPLYCSCCLTEQKTCYASKQIERFIIFNSLNFRYLSHITCLRALNNHLNDPIMINIMPCSISPVESSSFFKLPQCTRKQYRKVHKEISRATT